MSRRRARERIGAFCLAMIPGLSIASYWVLSLAGGDSLSVAATYRYGDYNYFPPLAGLMHLSMGEWLVLEHLGEGLRSFPLPSLILHGASLSLFGPIGFLIADVAVAVAMYLASRRLFRTCGLRETTALVLALVVSCGLLGWPRSPLLTAFDWLPTLHLWGLRFPRPFLTDLFLISCVGSWMRIFVWRIESWREWALFGVWFGLLLQSRYYSAATIGLAIGLAAPVLLYRPSGWRGALRSLGVFTGATALVSLPFAAQRMFENPDVPARFGAFPVDRLQPLFLESATGHFGTALVIAAVPATILFLNRRSVPEASERLKANLGLVTMCLLSLFALPLSTILLGQTIQPYHFADEAVTFKTISIVVATAQGFDLATAWLHRRYPAIGRYPALRRAMLVAVAALCLSIGVKLHQPVIADQLHERRDFAAYQVRGYRQAFRALTNELGHDRYAAAQVLGTLDVQVLDWWSLFGGMHAFAPEPCSTNIGDDEVEDRLLRLFRELGASRRRVARLVNDPAVLIFFLGCAKYQVSPGHSFAPISDYSPAVQQRFARSSPLWSWSIALPTRETRRLVERYDRTPEGQGDLQLDLLVLGPGRLDRGLAPSPERFQLTYQNALFRVYLNVEANLPGEKS